jgi:hypothetical protein
MDHEYDPDLTLIVEADQKDLERMARVLADMEDESEQLGQLMPKLQPLIKKLGPQAAAVIAPIKKAEANRVKLTQAMNRLLQREPARVQACKAWAVPRRSPITQKDLAGRVPTPTPLYAVMTFKVGPLSLSIRSMSGQNVRAVKAFHKGIDDDGAPYGIDVPIDRHRTNLITGGALPDGHTFIGHGIEVEVQAVDRGEVNAADLRIIGEALVRWGDRNGSNMVSFARVAECPPTTGIITAAGGGNELGVRFAGPPFRSKTTLLTLKGGEKGHELQLEFPDPDLELQQAYNVRVSLMGKYYQRPTGT